MIDTLMLQAINRWQPVFTHLASASTVHPEAVYLDLIGLAGELATFTSQERRPREFPAYRHDQLQPTFAAVVAALRQALSAVLEQGAVAVPLIDRGYGIRVAQVSDRSIYGKYSFILAAKASLAPDVLVRNFTGQVKVGPVEQIRELVQSSLPGVMIRNLPSAPRQIPHHTGKVYFQLDKSSPLWRQVITSSAMAMHVAGDFPGLELELWAVKD
jgi:type VI secretion system protein ImpJ